MCMGRELESADHPVLRPACSPLGLGKGDKVRYGGSCAQYLAHGKPVFSTAGLAWTHAGFLA